MNAELRALLLLLLLSPVGCVFGPSYAGGPTSEDPHGIVDPEEAVSILFVDGLKTPRSSSIYVEPGLRQIRVRIEFPMTREDAKPFEIRDIELRVQANHLYEISRKDPPEDIIELGPPYELLIREFELR